MSEMETRSLEEAYPGYDDITVIADSFSVGDSVTESGTPYMAVIVAVDEARKCLHLPMPADMAERLGWLLIEAAQRHRVDYGED